jgi:glycerol uptake facilitator-like aquaporin
MVAAYIGAAYWFTASTSFANPAAAFGRMFSDSFAGISPSSVPAFVLAQVIGAGAAAATARWFEPPPPARSSQPVDQAGGDSAETSRSAA